MAKLASTITLAAVFLFLAVSPAYLQEVDQKQDQEVSIPEETVKTLPDLEKQVILLPSDSGEHVAYESDAENQEKTETESAISAEVAEPLTMINFRPINRGFHRRPFLSFRHGHRFNCRHRRKFRPWDPRFQKKEISYGNDMLMADGKPTFDPEMRGREHLIVEKEAREDFDHHHHRRHGPHGEEEDEREEDDHHHRHGPHGEEEEEHEHGPHPRHGPHGGDEEEHEHGPHPRHGPHGGDEEEHEHGPQPHPHHHHHHHHMEEMDEEEEHKGGFMKVFRKFLNHF